MRENAQNGDHNFKISDSKLTESNNISIFVLVFKYIHEQIEDIFTEKQLAITCTS